MKKGTLFLIPATLGEEGINVISQEVKDVVQHVDLFIVENEKSARRYLRSIGYKKEFSENSLVLMDKNFPEKTDKYVFEYLLNGNDVGLISEAGMPCIADPGNYWVREAHRLNIKVKPITGPSSIILAIVASGFNGQQFRFNGYLPIKSSDRINALKKMEEVSISKNETQIFIETPYRNNSMLDDILKTCSSKILLCIAAELTQPNEFIKTLSIAEWKKNKPDLHHKPTVFLIYSK
ncbi:S-adenosylmethionine-dependent methyltransferase [Bacteroidota bacterium]|nr:S-adenosylmethionine-dependent methyltransferase [Bacteroidota bacterium]